MAAAADGPQYEAYLRELADFSGASESKLAHDGAVDKNAMHAARARGNLLGGSDSLGGYQNYEQDVIREAYSSSSYSSLRDLPNMFRPGEVALARQLKVLEMQKVSALPEEVLAARRQAARSNGLFQQFEYVPSRYTLAKELEAQERMRSKAKVLQLGRGQDFVCSSSAAALKHEDGFGDKDYRFPYQSDAYDGEHMRATQERLMDKARILHGPFLPSGRAALGTGLVTKAQLPDITKGIEALLLRDWGDCLFEVKATEDDMLAVRFELLELDGQLLGLRAYMNMLETTNKQVQRYALTRSGKEWNLQPGDGWIYFMFRPPWVKAQ